MAKYYWEEDDDDDDEDSYYDDLKFDLSVRGINDASLTQRFFDILEQYKQIFNLKAQDPVVQCKLLDEELERLKQSIMFEKKNLENIATLRATIASHRSKMAKNSHLAYSQLRDAIDSNDEAMTTYEKNGWTDKPEYALFKAKHTVLVTLSKMKTIQEVDKYLEKWTKAYDESAAKLKEYNDETNEIEEKKEQAKGAVMDLDTKQQIKQKESAFVATKNSFVHDFGKFAIVHPTSSIVEAMRMMANAVLFTSGLALTPQILSTNIFDSIIKNVHAGKIKNQCMPQKNISKGR